MENVENTPESVWAAFRETDRQRKENERMLTEKFAETDRLMEKSRADFDQRIKKLEKMVGGISNNQGFFAEEYFINSVEKGKQNFLGETFDEIQKNAKGFKTGFRDEYDILLINGKSVAIIEIKYKAHKDDIPEVLRKAETFRANFPYYAEHKIYLGFASMAFYPDVEKECIEQGIAIVKQVGETVVINDEHLKVF